MTAASRFVSFLFGGLHYLVIFDPWIKSKSKLSGKTKHRGRGLWLGTPQEFCRWRQSQLLLAFLCRMTSNILEKINFKIWFINHNLINLRATSTGDASFYSQIGIFHLALTIPRKENAAGDHKICTILQGGKNFPVYNLVRIFFRYFLLRDGPHMLISKTGYAKKLTP